MLSYIELKNFKSFSDIKFDLRGPYGEPKKVAFIYGENGSGKTNLMLAMLFLVQTLYTLKNQIKFPDFKNDFQRYLDDGKEVNKIVFDNVMRMQFYTLSNLIDDYTMLGNERPMSLKFGFRFGRADGSYYIELSGNEVIKEELRYQINQREGVFFSLSSDSAILSPTIFSDNNYRKELLENIEKYWGKHTFMSILFSEIKTKNPKFIESRISGNLLTITRWLNRLSVLCTKTHGSSERITTPFKFLQHLDRGVVKNRNDRELKFFEATLNLFFTQLYSDIKEVVYVFTPLEKDFSYELYFRKQIDGKTIRVPMSLESAGTKRVLKIFPLLFNNFFGASVFVDEIDNGIHDLLIKIVLEHLDDSYEGQFIATTHNTLLLESLPPDQVYIISADANGNKTINCLTEYKDRTQKNHSIRSKYLRGDYEGIPYIGYFDFRELLEDALDKYNPLPEKDGAVE